MKKIIKRIFFSILIFVTTTLGLGTFVGCCTFSGPKYQGEKKYNFNGEEFVNQNNIPMKDGWDMMKWGLEREPGEWPEWIYSEPGPPPPERVGLGELRITFINHSTVLIQMDSLNIITDPVWSHRISPVSWAGPSRKRDPGLKFEDLPPIDYVLVSHNHYDHCDINTLLRLKKVHNPQFVTSLGNSEFFVNKGLTNTKEMDWWDELPIGKNNILYFVPAQHFSSRNVCDRNRTLWGGFVILSAGGPVYFAGDTGFGVEFQQIYKRFGQMRFSMLPIGAFIPNSMMAHVHLSPCEAVEAHKILNSQYSIGIHWGTFRLADDGLMDPENELKESLIKEGISVNDFSLFEHGKGYTIPTLNQETAENK